VLAASDGEEAVTAFLADPDGVHLAIIDVVMPKLSGPKAY
jgi:DNA-binding response OmpR family regulator